MMHSDGERAESSNHLPVPGPARSAYPAPYGAGSHDALGSYSLPPGLASKPNAVTLLKALQRRWLLASSLGIVCAALAAAAAWFLIPPRYSAYAVLSVASRSKFALEEEKGADGNTVVFQKTQAAMVKSQPVLTKAMTKYKAGELPLLRNRPNALEWLEKELQVDFPLTPEYMRVSLAGDRPQDLESVVNAVVHAYLDVYTEQEQKDRSTKIQMIENLINNQQEELRGQRTAYRKLAEAAGSGNPFINAVRQNFQQIHLQDSQKELTQIQRDLRKAQAASDTEQRIIDGGEPLVREADIETVLNADPTVQQYQQELNAKQKQYDETVSRLKDGDKSPHLLPLKADIISLKQSLAAYREQQKPKVIAGLKDKMKVAARERIAQGKKTILQLKEEEKIVGATVQQLSDLVKASATGTIDLDSNKEEVEALTASLRTLRSSHQRLAVEKNAPPRVALLEEPNIRRAQAQKNQIMFASMAGMGAMAVVLLLVAYLEFQTRRVTTSDDVVYGLGWRLVGALPALPDGARGRLRRNGMDDKYWHSILTESVDATRTMLLHAARTEGLRTVMVTSAVAGEGKTSLSCHLATSLARAGRKTLLIDCDLRSPAAHRLFDLPAVPGFSEVLRREADVADVIHPTPAENLWLIPAGKCDAQTLQSLAQDAVAPILNQLKEQYEFIIIDSSPVLPVVDALVIGQHVDVVIFSLLREVSRIPNVYAAYQRLATLGIRMLGAVVNGVQKDAYGVSYKYYSRQTN